MTFPPVSIADWRAQVEKELAGADFEKALVHMTAEGLKIQPLYAERPAEPAVPTRTSGAPVGMCMPGEEVAGWRVVNESTPLAVPLDVRVLVSTLEAHAAGADAADELAAALSMAAARLGAGARSDAIGAQIAVGRDTFGELCKLRALRVCWGKLLAAAGANENRLALLHAVASTRTLTERDPWVNMLRVTTQMFAAILGGADVVTPRAYDTMFGDPSPLGSRVAQNTVLVLREESQLGRVVDPAAGSYHLEARTWDLAREAWRRFRAIEADGGIAALVADGRWARRLDEAWKKRSEALAKRKEPIVGVSEFANLDEKLPEYAQKMVFVGKRDSEIFDSLRRHADWYGKPLPRVSLVTLGPPAEHRARLGFASGFFAVGGLRAEATASTSERAEVACLCGADERYAAEAVAAARALKAAGCPRVWLAGRPGALEASLREAGVDGFIYVGCDVAAALGQIL